MASRKSDTSYRTFHPAIAVAYDATHSWLNTVPKARGYRQKQYKEIKNLLEKESLLSVACQFRTFFPAHYFKVIHTLEEVISDVRLIAWLKHNPRICILDVGCGAGAGSVAFVETIMRLQEAKQVPNLVNVFCIGVDPNPWATVLYDQFLHRIKSGIDSSKIALDYDCEPEGIPRVTSWIIDRLDQKREEWNLPRLSQVVMMQVNVVSPLSKDYEQRQEKYKIQRMYNTGTGQNIDKLEGFGREESLAYKSVFESVAIDNLHVVTVGTDNYMLNERVQEMGRAIDEIFNKNYHRTELLGEGQQRTAYINPRNSYFPNGSPYPSKPFHVNAISITNQEFRGDKDWQEVVADENLKVAWVKTRLALLRESFVDEVEIRLFENNLDENLARMQQQLIAYAEELRFDDDYVAYKVPKNAAKARPRGLSRMEEELLSVAIVQKLGNKESQLRGSSFAYRIKQKSKGRDTEYLYTRWFEAYQGYLREAREEAKKNLDGAVLRADIRSFYTDIVQQQLVETTQGLTQSQRVQWLIKLLLSKNLDEHELGRGIVQGSISSGFYGNIYLTDIDAFFGKGNEWDVRLFRYVDDMIFVIPQPKDGRDIKEVVKEVQETLENKLKELGLELNTDKTDVYYNITEFIEATEDDKKIQEISEQFERTTNALWILDKNRRADFIGYSEHDDLWWHRIEQYCRCLYRLGMYTVAPIVSRRVFKYLFHSSRRRKDLKRSKELTLPNLPNKDTLEDYHKWAQAFIHQNGPWIIEKTKLHNQVVNLLQASWEELKDSDDIEIDREKELERRIRFAINKLTILGFNQTTTLITEILVEQPWLIREPLRIIESLAYQGFPAEVVIIFDQYKGDEHPMNEYLRAAVLRAIRFLPQIRNRHWEFITDYALHGSKAERLMATETWLYLNKTPGFANQEKYVEEMRRIVILDSSLTPRLVKNYLLLISLYNAEVPDLIETTDDPILANVYDIISKGKTSELFDYQEPELIREKFYNGQRPNDWDYDPPY